jgi:hypothetical protein
MTLFNPLMQFGLPPTGRIGVIGMHRQTKGADKQG